MVLSVSLMRRFDGQDVTYDNVGAHLHHQANAYFSLLLRNAAK